MGNKALTDIVTFTRASSGTYFDSTGALKVAGPGQPRYDYNPSTNAFRGILIEESRTNVIRNNSMVGAVVGTSGTLPTNWSLSGTAVASLTRTIVGFGSVQGMPYIDIRFQGTLASVSTLNIIFDTSNSAAATTGQVWAQSVYISIVGGSVNNLSGITLKFDEGSPSYLRTNTTTTINSLTSSLTRYSGTGTIGASTTQINSIYLGMVCAASSIDVTFRFALPQLELGAFATSPILTSTTSVTRAVDLMTAFAVTNSINQTEATIYAEVMRSAYTGSGKYPSILELGDGTSQDRILLYSFLSGGNDRYVSEIYDNTTSQTAVGSASALTEVAPNTVAKIAFAYALNDQAISVNGCAAITDSSITLPTGLVNMYIGNTYNANQAWSGCWIRKIKYYPKRLTNAELQALTS